MNNLIYLDNNATTRTDPKVVEAMLPYFTEYYGNASSNTHLLAWQSEYAIDKATKQICDLINAKPNEIVYTSGATEANNLLLKSLGLNDKDHIIVSEIEHKCILETAKYLNKKFGTEITFAQVTSEGVVDLQMLEKAIKPNTKLISIMYANNEIHSLNPINEISKLCKKHNILFHVDAAQSIGKFQLNVKDLDIDFMSVSGHKFYAPKGIGFLYLKGGIFETKLNTYLHGGGQEKGLRSGTLPVPLIVGLGKAAELANNIFIQTPEIIDRITNLTSKMFDYIRNEINEITLNGTDFNNRQLGGLSLTIPNIDTGELQFHIPHICYSRGSACSSGGLDYSYVLKAIGLTPELAVGTMRLSIGKFNTEDEINQASTDIVNAVKKIHKLKITSIPNFGNKN